MRVLIIKISSMGDVIHTLPAVSDAMQHVPDISFDWLVDRAFSEIPAWHPAVRTVISSAHRQWKRHKLSSLYHGEIRSFLRCLRHQHYDLVIDAQASLKSAAFAMLARAKRRAGMDAASVREYGAHWVCQERYAIDKTQHAVDRLRRLFAAALHYPPNLSTPCFGIAMNRVSGDVKLPELPYVVFVPNASWESKLYPEQHWQELLACVADDFLVALPWGSMVEKMRAERIAHHHKNAMVLPRMGLSELAHWLVQSRGVISVDTGLGHLAAALNVPTLSLYGPTDPVLIGTQGSRQQQLQADLPCIRCRKRQCCYQGVVHTSAVCLSKLHPVQVWQQFRQLIV